MMNEQSIERATPVEEYRRKRRRNVIYWLLFVIACVAIYLFWRFVPETPERFTSIDEHFKYGSIGSDNLERGIPFRILNVLPVVFEDLLPAPPPGVDRAAGQAGYEAFGFIREPKRDRYIGFSRRRVRGVDLAGLNCSVCHTSTYREQAESEPVIVLGMPAHQLDLQGFFRFLFACVSDSRFNTETLIREMDKQERLGPIDRVVFQFAVERFRVDVLEQKAKLNYWNEFPDSGAGRIDTFGPYKALFFDLPPGDVIGTSDFPSLWNQELRRHMQLHWDGNNVDVDERNISAAIGAGATADTLDHPSIGRVADWIDNFGPPDYPMPIDQRLAARGAKLFKTHCASCHGESGAYVGKVTPISDVGTDPDRLDSFTTELVSHMNTLGEGRSWAFKSFEKTEGYANSPLDGVWLRSPYLHNGSVPTLMHLLNPDERPDTFFRGNDVMDWDSVGFVWDEPANATRRFTQFDTSKPGNGNQGHRYGADLSDEEKLALLEYLKTL